MAKEKAKAGATTTAATETMTAAVDRGRTGDMTNTTTGDADMAAPPGTMKDERADGAQALGDHLRPTHGTAIALSHK